MCREGLLEESDDIRRVYYHGVSHHLGLDTHDASDRNKPLEPGNVITVEPGLYFKEYGIGVRIEDDILITDGVSEVLTEEIKRSRRYRSHHAIIKEVIKNGREVYFIN